MVIVDVTKENVTSAGEIHSLSWKKSHEAFCSKEFIEKHTAERQTDYLRQKMSKGSNIYMLIDDELPVAIISITGSLIEDLYVRPDCQQKGYGTTLLNSSLSKCCATPMLWILENNSAAQRFYEKNGFLLTGKRKNVTSGLDELEMTFTLS
jgi:ribosomal protein S18 acetylase RimI-like enzyme